MRVYMVACAILFLTACGAKPASTAQPAAPDVPAATLPATVAAGTSGPVARAAVSTATALSPVTPAAAQAATVAPALTEYTADNGERVLGKPGAPITMLDYSDFQ